MVVHAKQSLSEWLTPAEVVRIDPLRILNLREVIERTGYGRRRIFSLLALDERNNTPGVHFAAPLRRPGTKHLEWREITLVRWLEKQEEAHA